MTRIVVTGAGGLLGWHASARLHAANCAARFQGQAEPYDIVRLDHAAFDNGERLSAALAGADVVLHFAGVNRASEGVDVGEGNPAIATTLAEAYTAAGSHATIVYANSTHAAGDSVYGVSKARAAEILSAVARNFVNLILPHIFGECARPYYNNVTATLIDQIWAGEPLTINPEGRVSLLHAGAAAQMAIDAGLAGKACDLTPGGRDITVGELAEVLQTFHADYARNIYPDLTDRFTLDLFNTYRVASYPAHWPFMLKLNTDPRGVLFEAAKGGGGGQSFVSSTVPGITRGDHFHLDKVERFMVLSGEAMIRIRRVLDDTVWEFPVTGDRPVAVDMPTLHTHSIENTGSGDLLTLFWSHDIFDPENSDTYADAVLRAQ